MRGMLTSRYVRTRTLCKAKDRLADNHLQAHPEAKRWQHTPFPYHNDFQVLVGEENHATRERAYWPSRGNDNESGDKSSIQGVGDTDDVGVSQSTDTTSQVSIRVCLFTAPSTHDRRRPRIPGSPHPTPSMPNARWNDPKCPHVCLLPFKVSQMQSMGFQRQYQPRTPSPLQSEGKQPSKP